MHFQNFNSFDFMYQRLSQPITVVIHHDSMKQRDEHGKLIKGIDETFHLNEPIINNTNPNFNFENQPGGQQQQVRVYWESKKIMDAPKGTLVKTNYGNFKTTAMGIVTDAKIVYYQLKRIGDNND